MNIWKDICTRALENGQLGAIKKYIRDDVTAAASLEGVRSVLEEWVADIYDIEEAMNGSCDD